MYIWYCQHGTPYWHAFTWFCPLINCYSGAEKPGVSCLMIPGTVDPMED